MSAWHDPVGPKDKRVYIRRRILVLLGLLAAVAAVLLVIFRPDFSGDAIQSNPVDLPDDLTPAVQQEAQQQSDPDAIPACAPGQLVVTPVTDALNYDPEQKPMLSLTVENTGGAACTADLGTAGMTFEITSGSDQVWRSTDCQKNPDHRAVILEPGSPLTTSPIAWDRTRSDPETCELEREPMPAGGASYHLSVAVADVKSAATAQFQLY